MIALPKPHALHTLLLAGLLGLALLLGCGGGSGEDGAQPAVDPSWTGLVPDLVVAPGSQPGTVRLRFRTPAGADGSAPAAYSVLVSRRHIQADTLDDATAMPLAATPGAVGSSEDLLLSGLEPGRTLQFAVRATWGSTTGAVAPGVATRVPGVGLTPLPGDAVTLSAPGTIDTDGAYRLTGDIAAAGTAFRITANRVVLDLGGHTITYGTAGGQAHGVFAEWLAADSRVEIRNGRIEQGGGGGTACHGVYLRGMREARVAYLDVDVHGPDAIGILGVEVDGDVRVDHCRVAARTQVVSNRHFPGVSAIYLENMTAALEVDQNLVTASPQWGIRIQGNATAGLALVHHNVVSGTKALVPNGYMIGIYKPDVDVFENRLVGESRGIHLDGEDGHGRDAWVHDNELHVQDQTNSEYPDRHWAHGIKVEEAGGALVERNAIFGLADDAHADIYALDLQIGPARGIRIRGNRVDARSVSAVLEARALQWSLGADGSDGDTVIEGNVFASTDILAHRDWGSGRGAVTRANWWVALPPTGANSGAVVFERFDTSDQGPSAGHGFRDPITTEDVHAVTQWASPGPYDSSRRWTVRARAMRAGQPVAGARIRVRDRDDAVVLDATTDKYGLVSGQVVGSVVRNGPVVNDRGPHRIAIDGAGFAAADWPLQVTGPVYVTLDPDGAGLVMDTAAPGAVEDLVARPLSASRLLVRWSPAEDDGAVVGYLVYVDDVPVAVAAGTEAIVAGLVPGRSVVASVRAVDGAGTPGPLVRAAAVALPAEDRGR